MSAGAGAPHDAFSQTYEEARGKFLAAARDAGLDVESHPHPQRGRDGETIAMDVVRVGDADASSVLFLTSGCHGVEGFCGSGVQVDLLRNEGLGALLQGTGVALALVHALNPHGFSWWRRTTHENIDLNRNFHDFSRPLPDNAAYRELHSLLVPEHWPPDPENQRAVAEYIGTRGLPALQAAVSGGQHEFADGLFFGGRAPAWSNITWRDVLRRHGARARRIAWIDIHTGLGPTGVGERIFAARDDAATLARARAWWDGGGATPITSIYDGSSTSAVLTGMMFTSVYEECPRAEFTGMALEFGTVPVLETMQALRGDQWLQRRPDADPRLARAIKQTIRDAFYTDTAEWKEQVLRQADEAVRQAVAGLT